jgi:short-subunit dehydrogenase
MSAKLKPLKSQTIVITGASSGIGLLTAQNAAKRGANVVLVARNEAVLDRIAQEINMKGGHAIVVAADVADREALEQVAHAAVERFGGIDTWVNDAGIGIVGRIEETTLEDAKRLFDTNFWGTVNGCSVALSRMKEKGGAIINVGSVESDVAVPLQGMYAASKHAIKGYTDALRIELADENAPISLTLIKPSAINTPFMHHARNYTENEPKLPPPVYPPEEVAYAILHAAEHPRRDIIVGSGGRMMGAMNFHVPKVMDKVNEKFILRQQSRDEPPRDPLGTLFQTGSDGTVIGDEPSRKPGPSVYTRAVLNPVATGAFVVAAGIATALFLGRDIIKKRIKVL